MNAALNIERSVTGQPWRWRRQSEPEHGIDALVSRKRIQRMQDAQIEHEWYSDQMRR